MTRRPFPTKTIQTARDVSIFEVNDDSVMVVGCDSTGGIGPKPLDKIKVSGYTLGRFTARVVLMEVLAVGAMPICLANTLGVEPDPTGFEILEGINSEVQLARLGYPLVITGSMEKNVPVKQTGIGVTVVGLAPKDKLKIGVSQPEDSIVAVGIPSVKNEVLAAEKQHKIADLEDLVKLTSCGFVHEVIPVGSLGIISEANVLAHDSCLQIKLEENELETRKSAGPATVVLVSVSKTDVNKLSGVIDKPLHVIGSFF